MQHSFNTGVHTFPCLESAVANDAHTPIGEDPDQPSQPLSQSLLNWFTAQRYVVIDATAAPSVRRHGFDQLLILFGPPEFVCCEPGDDDPHPAYVQRIECALAAHHTLGLMAGRPAEVTGLRYFQHGAPRAAGFALELPSIFDLVWPDLGDDLSSASTLPLTSSLTQRSVFEATSRRWQRALDLALDHDPECWSAGGEVESPSPLRVMLSEHNARRASDVDRALAALSYPETLRLDLLRLQAATAPRALTVADINRLCRQFDTHRRNTDATE